MAVGPLGKHLLVVFRKKFTVKMLVGLCKVQGTEAGTEVCVVVMLASSCYKLQACRLHSFGFSLKSGVKLMKFACALGFPRASRSAATHMVRNGGMSLSELGLANQRGGSGTSQRSDNRQN